MGMSVEMVLLAISRNYPMLLMAYVDEGLPNFYVTLFMTLSNIETLWMSSFTTF